MRVEGKDGIIKINYCWSLHKKKEKHLNNIKRGERNSHKRYENENFLMILKEEKKK